jgi:hypothetical protein
VIVTVDAEVALRLVRAVGATLVAELEALARESANARSTWTDQAASPLGRRRHVAAVRRRIAAGEPGAALVGRSAMLSPEALSEELARLSKRSVRKPKSAAAPKAEDVTERLERRLGVVR